MAKRAPKTYVPPAEPEHLHATARAELEARGVAEVPPGAAPKAPAQAPGAPGSPPVPPAEALGSLPPSPADENNVGSLIHAVLRVVELALAFVAPPASRKLGKRAEEISQRAIEGGAGRLAPALGASLPTIGFFSDILIAPALATFAKEVRVKRARASKAAQASQASGEAPRASREAVS
jgi:hypothetical protein